MVYVEAIKLTTGCERVIICVLSKIFEWELEYDWAYAELFTHESSDKNIQ